MARRSFFPLLCLGASAAFAAKVAAGSPDPSASNDRREEEVVEGEKDLEDLLIERRASSFGPRHAGPTYLGVSAFGGSRSDGQREFGALLVVGLSLDRFAYAPKVVPPAPAPHDPRALGLRDDLGAASAWPDASATLLGEATAMRLLPKGVAQTAGDRADRSERAASGPIVATPEVARSCVRAAWRAMGLADDASIDSLAARARASAALPELRLRAMRTIDESGRLTLSDADPFRYTEVGGATNWLEARLTFRLDRLLFADEEISLERVRLDRAELRARTTAKVLQVLFEWQRAYALVQDPTLPNADHLAALMREIEAGAVLDVMTDGWFGRFRATLGDRTR